MDVCLSYYHCVGNCGAFCGLKRRFWWDKMYFSPLARSRDFSDCFVVIFDSFYVLNSLQSNNNCNIVYILWHKYVWALFKAHFNPRLAARAKTTMCRTQNIFTPANVNSIVLVHYNPTCDFSIEALCLSIIGLISIPSMSRSLSPWEKLSSSSWAELQSTI